MKSIESYAFTKLAPFFHHLSLQKIMCTEIVGIAEIQIVKQAVSSFLAE